MLFYFWQLQPGTPGKSKTVSRPPKRFGPFKVLSASPLALLPVGLTCFISAGRSQNPSLPGWVGFSLCRRADWLTKPLGFLNVSLTYREPMVCREMSVGQLESSFLFTHLWPGVSFDRRSKPRALRPHLVFCLANKVLKIRLAINLLVNTHITFPFTKQEEVSAWWSECYLSFVVTGGLIRIDGPEITRTVEQMYWKRWVNHEHVCTVAWHQREDRLHVCAQVQACYQALIIRPS